MACRAGGAGGGDAPRSVGQSVCEVQNRVEAAAGSPGRLRRRSPALRGRCPASSSATARSPDRPPLATPRIRRGPEVAGHGPRAEPPRSPAPAAPHLRARGVLAALCLRPGRGRKKRATVTRREKGGEEEKASVSPASTVASPTRPLPEKVRCRLSLILRPHFC